MIPISIIIDGERGYMFEGEVAGTVVFVPEELAVQIGDIWRINQRAFLLSGWAEKSMRFSQAAVDGDRVFPLENQPIDDRSDPRLTALLSRLDNAYEVSFT